MSIKNDPHYLKQHPEIFKQMCYDLIKNISETFCANEQRIKNAGFMEEVFPVLQKAINESIDQLWTDFQFDENARNLVQLINTSENNQPQWRPETGKVDITNERLMYNFLLKQRLEKLIGEKEKEIDVMEEIITTKRNEIDDQMVKITKVLNKTKCSSKS